MNKLKTITIIFSTLCGLFLFFKNCDYRQSDELTRAFYKVQCKELADSKKQRERDLKEWSEEKVQFDEALMSKDKAIALLRSNGEVLSEKYHAINTLRVEELESMNLDIDGLLEEHKKKDEVIDNLKLQLKNRDGIIQNIEVQKEDYKKMLMSTTVLLGNTNIAFKKCTSLNEMLKKIKPKRKWFIFGPSFLMDLKGRPCLGVGITLNLIGF